MLVCGGLPISFALRRLRHHPSAVYSSRKRVPYFILSILRPHFRHFRHSTRTVWSSLKDNRRLRRGS